MVNEQKIVTMTQLALYDKHEGPQDRAANDYFRHDFIYRNNLGTRLAVGMGALIILAVYWLQALVVNQIDIFNMDLQAYITDSVMFLLAILAVYSLIGSIQGTRQYYLVQKRLSQYQALVRQLERMEERGRKAYADDGEMPPRRQDNIAHTRPHNPSPPVRTAPVDATIPPRPRPAGNDYPRRRPPQDTPPPRPGRPSPEHTRPPRRRPEPPIEHTRAHTRARPRITKPESTDDT